MWTLLGPAFSGDALHRDASLGLSEPLSLCTPRRPANTSPSASVISPLCSSSLGQALFGGNWQTARACNGGSDAHCYRQYFTSCMVTRTSSCSVPHHGPQFQEVQSPK